MSELFPELDAIDSSEPSEPREDGRPLSAATKLGLHAERRPAVEPPADPDAVHIEGEARLHRPGVAAGVEALARFEQAFGLQGLIRSLKKTEGDEIELVVELPDGKLGSGSLVPPGTRAWKQGKSFGLSYRGERLHSLLAKALLRFMARYDGVPYEAILAQVVPEAGDELMLNNDYADSVFYAFAPASGWRRFFEGTELYRGTCASHTGKVAVIDHTDIECLFNTAPQDHRLPSFFSVPGVDARLELGAERERPTDGPADASRHLFTDIQDRDVILGADKLLDQALENLADDPDKPDMVFIQSGCLPDVTGDDLEASAARTAAKLRLPVVVVGMQNDPVSGALSQLVAGREITPERPREPASVALLGVPDFFGKRSLGDLLERAGVRVLVSVLPNLDVGELDLLERAAVLVGYPWDRHRETARRLAQRLAPAPLIQAGAPFGVDGTARWLRAIGDAVDRRDAIEDSLGAELDHVGPRWRELSARARRYRVGFVVDQPNWRAALAPKRSLGVPMLPVLLEMGFGVDVLTFVGAGARAVDQREGRVRVRSFRTCAELDALLREGDAVLWYSEMAYERRFTRTGKTPFSLRQFRMGLRGAVESLEELVRMAELPFYRRYARYLGPAFTELEDQG